MKRIILIVVAVVLVGCSNDDTTKLQEEHQRLQQQLEKKEKQYKALKKKNKEQEDVIKDKEGQLKKEQEVREAEIKKQIEAEKKLAEEKKKQEEATKRQRAEEKLTRNKARLETKQQLPNTIVASTGGTSEIIFNDNNINIFMKNKMEVSINQLQIFKVSNMPKNAVALFDGKETGYVIIYVVSAKNTENVPLYYNNQTKLVAGNTVVYSDFAAFIEPSDQENGMKESSHLNEYHAKEETVSYKSIPITEKVYKQLQSGNATLTIQSEVSMNKDFTEVTHAEVKPYTFK